MVQLKRDDGLDIGKEEPNERGYRKNKYWKLGSYTDETAPELKSHLAAYDYKYPKNASKAKLLDAVGRCQRGLLSYEKCSVGELLGFCLARKLSLPSEGLTIPRLARILETADDDVDATFPRFMERPAELRNRIYELHFRDYDEISTEHDQPPITEASPESLPLFYKYVTFTWDLSLDSNFCIYEHLFTGDSSNLTKIPEADLAQIKNFKLHWTNVSRGARGFTHRRVDFSLELSQLKNVKKMDTIFRNRVEPESQEVEAVIKLVLCEVGYWDVPWKLQQHYLIAFRDAVNKVLQTHMFGR
ncbi:hypothetical protein Q7P35_000876 [Cladosporium inversicolor]